jgi:Ca2+-binding RTX toxin-like protein
MMTRKNTLRRLGRLAIVTAVTAVGLLAAASPALASEVFVSEGNFGAQVDYVAEVGEVNMVTITGGARGIVIDDPGATITPGAGCTTIMPTRVRCESPSFGQIDEVWATLGDGNDFLSMQATLPSLPIGFSMIGGGPGDDFLVGGPGTDNLFGNDGADRLFGGGSRDNLEGQAGSDSLEGGTGNDILNGGDGVNDAVDYTFRTASLKVTIDGIADDGEAGEGDNVQSNVENVLGGTGNDWLVGSAGANLLFGFHGDDRLDGGLGADELYGGPGDDEVDYRNRTAPLTVTLDGAPNDGQAGEGDSVGAWGDIERVVGGAGNDTLIGSSASDNLNGMDGDDVLTGGKGSDELYGGKGADTIYSADFTISVPNGYADTVGCGQDSDVAYIDWADRNVADCERVELPQMIAVP